MFRIFTKSHPAVISNTSDYSGFGNLAPNSYPFWTKTGGAKQGEKNLLEDYDCLIQEKNSRALMSIPSTFVRRYVLLNIEAVFLFVAANNF